MRVVLVAVFVAMSAVSVGAQTPGGAAWPPTGTSPAAMTPVVAGTPAQTPAADRAQSLSDQIIEMRRIVDYARQVLEERRVEQMRAALGGLSLTADRMVLQQGGVFAEGVTITLDGAVITADDAFIQNGEVRLGANARVRFSPK